MKNSKLSTTLFQGAALLAVLSAPLLSYAGLQIPYTPDAQTLHLWHLDEGSGVQTSDAVSANGITLTNIGWPVGGPYTNTTLGSPGFTGMGNSVAGINKGHVLYGGPFPDVSQFCNQESGAFTFEALVKFDINPLGAIDAEIVAGDNGGGITVRGWQWRIFNGDMEWNLLAGSGSDNDFKARLPSSGQDAAITGAWYHAAVTFTGENPTNSDTPSQLTFYWTLLDENRTAASKLATFTMTRPLNGAPLGTAQPALGVAGSARNTSNNPGNNEGLIGSIDEVRISLVARGSNEMAFKTGGAANPPSFTTQPPASTLVGYGQTLTLPALVSGTPPLRYQWQRNSEDVQGQTDSTLVISNATFLAEGTYRLVVNNDHGTRTSDAAQVVVGAVPTGLAFTGLDTNGAVSAGNIPDPHWSLRRSADPTYLGPDAPIFEFAFPIQFAPGDGAFSPVNGRSMWIGAAGNAGGITANSPAGQYVYRSRFLIDSADPATLRLAGNLWVNGSISDILVNGQSTGVALAPGGTLYVTTFALTNGFVPGWNTVDFVETIGNAISGIRVEMSGVGQALPAGLPTIFEQPADQAVRDGAPKAVFSVAALARPPLTYQWRQGGDPIPGATGRTYTILNPTGSTRNYDVLVKNDSGSVQSRTAVLNIVPNNQPPVPKAFSLVTYQAQNVSIPLSDVVQLSFDPDYDPIAFIMADSQSTNGAMQGQFNVLQNGANIDFTPVSGFVGLDQFTYTISDPMVSSVGTVSVLQLQLPQETNVFAAPGGNAVTFDLGMVNPPAGYSFLWQFNGTNIQGAVTGRLTIPSPQLAHSGTYRLVVTDPLGQSWPSPLLGLTVGNPGTGTGLLGDYYAFGNFSTNFTGAPALSRVDPGVDFNFLTDAPDPLLPVDYFQIRWHGQVQPLFTDVYTFYTTTDDGARLWVNNQLLVDRWQNQGATTVSGSIQLNAVQKYDLVMEYYENTSQASARLSWSSLHQPFQVIPATQLYPTVGVLQPRLVASLVGTNVVLNWSGTFTLQSAPDVMGQWGSIGNLRIGPYTLPLTAPQKAFYRLVTPGP
jgi:hypothetical protein